ncbi:reverse transcriptase domain-containing protein [Tanacetum coccineum]
MKLNPKKCAFGMREGTFLGYKVDADRLRVCPDKVEAVLNLPSPKCLKECTKKSDFQWTAEAEMAFKQMRKLIAELPMLTEPKEKEELIMYLAAAKEAISVVLMTERDGKQTPIYFVNRALQGPEVSHTPMEKLILALHDIHYRPTTSVKGQILADFIVERPEDDPLDTLIEDKEELPDRWILFMDESLCIEGFEAGLIITNPKGMEFTYALRFRFNVTNNEAEYEAQIAGLRIAEQMGVKNLQANADSKLVANQQVLVEELKEKSIDEKEVLAVVEEEGHTWVTLIYEYLTEEILPEEKRKARAIRRKAGKLVLREIHEGNLIRESLPGLPPHAKEPVAEANTHHIPMAILQMGIDIVGPFPEGPRKVKFLIVAIDYFTKWIEAKSVATITGAQVKKFVWDNIHPQANSLAERENRSLGEGIKARLNERSKNWLEEISHVLWAHRTMIKSSNGETPFSLTYGAEAVIPVEIGMPTSRTAKVDMIKNDEALGVNLDLLEEKREQTAIHEAKIVILCQSGECMSKINSIGVFLNKLESIRIANFINDRLDGTITVRQNAVLLSACQSIFRWRRCVANGVEWIGRSMMCGGGRTGEVESMDVDVIVKPTNHAECTLKERPIKIRPHADMEYCLHALARRLAITSKWTTVFAAKNKLLTAELKEPMPTYLTRWRESVTASLALRKKNMCMQRSLIQWVLKRKSTDSDLEDADFDGDGIVV